ncbi:carboxylesterase family domain-containing protein [Phthorimaea operculella]|nr:carboxylesterase family domain-containing protein [Phthorimaea operculella]
MKSRSLKPLWHRLSRIDGLSACEPSDKMRWEHVAWLAAVLAAASGQAISIDDRLNGDNPSPPAPPATTTTEDPSNSAASYDFDVPDDRDADDTAPEDDNDYEETEPGQNNNTNSSEINGNESQQETTDGITNTTVQVTEQTPDTGNSNENGGEVSVEVEPESSNEVARSGENMSREATEPIDTEGGFVQGYLSQDSNIRSYIDIPYGKFEKLFEAPTAADPWDTIHNVSTHEKRCPQIDESGNFAGSLDCLTLSVFAPKDVQNAAVLFHIYDGDFSTGSADHNIYGPEYLVTKGIILVLPNYRLGALGFLCLNDDIAPGNAGLKDLALALEWTGKNIELFGGNTSKITVSADGRSGALAGFLALSPISRPYISGVITESGTMLAHWAIDRHPKTTISLLDESFQAQLGDNINVQSLVKAAEGIPFRPCIETGPNAFMKETPWEILHKKDQELDIPFIIGSANHAGLQEAMLLSEESLSDLDKNFTRFLPSDLKLEHGKDKDLAEEIKKLYFKNDSISLEHIAQISLLYTDAYYLGPSIRAARALVSAGARVYFYEFSFVGELNRILHSLPTTVQGAVRGDLACYTFMQDGEGPEQGSIEENMVNLITELWASFLQTGVPSADQITWKHLEIGKDKDEGWLSIGEKVEQITGLHVERLGLWTNIYDQHFIERNLAIGVRSCMFLIVTAVLLHTIRKV